MLQTTDEWNWNDKEYLEVLSKLLKVAFLVVLWRNNFAGGKEGISDLTEGRRYIIQVLSLVISALSQNVSLHLMFSVKYPHLYWVIDKYISAFQRIRHLEKLLIVFAIRALLITIYAQ